ncbi:MAG: MFS transporter, partial [Flavobacteriaceae bacterium]|nr:MFS transporter [Flavobacteriaceae bacterium]
VAALPWLVMLFFQPLWGLIADRYGKLRTLKTSLIFSVVLFGLFSLLDHGLTSIIIATFLLAVFNTPILPILDSIALDHVETYGSTSYSNIRFWGAPGYGLGAAVTGWLIPEFGIDVVFVTSSFFLLIVLGSVFKISVSQYLGKTMDISFKGLDKVLTEKTLLGFLIIIIIVSISQSAITFFFSLYMKQIGSSPEMTGTAIGIQAISELPFYFVGAWLLKKFKPNKIVFWAILGTALRMFFYSITENPSMVLFIETMNGITWALLWIASVEYINSLVPAKWRTTGQSLLWAAYFGAGAVLGNIISGNLYQELPMQQVYLVNSIAMLIIAGICGSLFLLSRFNKLRVTNSI